MSPKKSAPRHPKQGKLKKLSSKTVFQGKVFRVTSDRIKEPNGIVAERDVIRHGGSVVILPVDTSGGGEPRVLLERQYRYAAQDYMLELPAGRMDHGEQPLAGAKRELLEETGYKARRWKQALYFYPSPGFLDETMRLYLAEQLTAGKAQPEDDESIECHLVPLSKAVAMIRSGKIRDGKTIAGIYWLQDKLLSA